MAENTAAQPVAGPRPPLNRARGPRLATLRDFWGKGSGGEATIEFLLVSVLLLVPLAYLTLAIGQIQAATFAAEAATRTASRVIAKGMSPEQLRFCEQTAELVFADFGIPVKGEEVLQVRCLTEPCGQGGSQVEVSTTWQVPLPLLPDFMRDLPAKVPVQATQVVVLERYRELK